MPPFIVRVDPAIDFFTNNSIIVHCADFTGIQNLTPKINDTLIQVYPKDQQATVEAFPPVLNDKYYFLGDDYVSVWDGAAFQNGVAVNNGDLITDSSDGFIKIRYNDKMIKTNDGLQFFTIGDYNYAVYSGFEFNQTINCGLRQVSITGGSHRFTSELVDVRDFDPDSNEYHKLTIQNENDLGLVLYGSVYFKQWFYFEKGTLVGEPEIEIIEEGEDDGLGNEIINFSRMIKNQKLETELVPEYINDFLTFAKLHDDILFRFPFGEDITVENYDIQTVWMEAQCFATNELQLGLELDIIKTPCGQEVGKTKCVDVVYKVDKVVGQSDQASVFASNPAIGYSVLILDDTSGDNCATMNPTYGTCFYENLNTIATYSNTGFKYELPSDVYGSDELFLEDLETGDIYFWDGTEWTIFPLIECVTGNPIVITCKIPTGAVGKLYFRETGDINWTSGNYYSKDDLETGVNFTNANDDRDYDFRILVVSNSCDYGFSNIETCYLDAAGS